MAFSRAVVLCMSLGTLHVACIDWDSLRGSPADLGSENDDAGARIDPDASIAVVPLVYWKFAQLSEGIVDDVALLLPSVPLSLAPASDNAPVVEGENLWLRGGQLRAIPAAGQEVGRAVADAGGGLTVELWFQTSTIPQQGFLLGFDGRGFSMTVRDAELLVDVVTSNNVMTVASPLPFPARGQLHQWAFSYRPGLAALVTCYLDGKAVAVVGEENPVGVSKIVWPTTSDVESRLRVGDGQLDDLRVSTATIFARELDAQEIERLFGAGPSRR